MRMWTIRVGLVALALVLMASDEAWARGRCGGGGGCGSRGGRSCGGHRHRGHCGGGGGYSGGGCSSGGCRIGGSVGGCATCAAPSGGASCAGGVCAVPTTGGTGMAQATASATVVVSLPADAKLKIEGEATRSTSGRRVFVSPALERGKTYRYTLTAEVVRDGVRKTLKETVIVRAGQESSVRFADPVSTGVASR